MQNTFLPFNNKTVSSAQEQQAGTRNWHILIKFELLFFLCRSNKLRRRGRQTTERLDAGVCIVCVLVVCGFLSVWRKEKSLIHCFDAFIYPCIQHSYTHAFISYIYHIYIYISCIHIPMHSAFISAVTYTQQLQLLFICSASVMSSASAMDPFMLNRGPRIKPAIMQVRVYLYFLCGVCVCDCACVCAQLRFGKPKEIALCF